MKPLAIPANHGVMGQQEKHSVSIANSVCSINNLSRATAWRLKLLVVLLAGFPACGFNSGFGGKAVSEVALMSVAVFKIVFSLEKATL